MLRSKMAEASNSFYRNDAYSFASNNHGLGHNEITVHGQLIEYADGGGNPQKHIYIGISNADDPGNRWVMMPLDEVDNLVTALLYAKKLAQEPKLRRKRTENGTES